MRLARLLVVITPLALIGGIMYGCSSSRPEASSGDGTITPETCGTPGAVRDCVELVKSQQGIKTCASGTQTCIGGGWSTCVIGAKAGENILESSIGPLPAGYDPDDPGDGIHPLARSTARTDAGACANPCSSDCVGYDEDGGKLTLDASFKLDALEPFPGTNPGFENKVVLDRCGGGPGGGTNPACQITNWGAGPSAAPSMAAGRPAYACQADTYCSAARPDGGGGCCERFAAGETHDTNAPDRPINKGYNIFACKDAKPDLTISGACKLGSDAVIPVCNRGKGWVDAGATIAVTIAGPSGDLPTNACPSGATSCTLVVNPTLGPGDCQYVLSGSSASCDLNGNKVVGVNSNGAISECTIDMRDTFSDAGDAPGCANNWTAFRYTGLDPCPVRGDPKVVIEDYVPTCGTGSAPVWGLLGWKVGSNTGVFAGINVTFEVRSRPRFPDGGAGAWGSWGLAADIKSSGDPFNCPMSGGPSGCPKDIAPALGGGAAAFGTDVQVRITLASSTRNFPVLDGWSLAYTCKAVE